MLVGAKGESPEMGAGVLAPAGENGFVETVVDGDGVFREDDFAIGVAKFANADEGVGKSGHDVAGPGGVVWELGQVEAAGSGGVLDVAGGGTDANGGGSMADVSAMGTGSEVDVASACVGDCCVSEGEGRRMANRLESLGGGFGGEWMGGRGTYRGSCRQSGGGFRIISRRQK